ncbi:Sap-like sulfolipid-1-addressing protein [Isoptericola jiangsuensis]|uniref:Sap-like sulfolipid-1-addressing protein n=1 Tax=Isoptericola jiangsuensis TaxID=548579 RepID=A0A2A9ESM3_9MICO|nr:GAP family protein [Isoptericola jiangsuensis]PFG41753.1 Sap-like sulfolipid-1-addressing protein [Isoptericola jiangsuensis]
MELPVDLGGVDGAGPAALAGVLVVLALVDSTSFGTLLVPVWLLLTPGRVRAGRLLVYVGTVAVAYLAVGVLVLLAGTALLDRYGDLLDARPVLVVQLLAGVGLFAVSFRFDGKRARERAGAEGAAPGRLVRWRQRAMGVDATGGGAGALVGLALGAVAVEVASMLPYLAALGLLASSGLGTTASVGVLAAYCLVMVAPALLLLGGRLVAARAVDPLLRRVEAWLTRHAAEMTGWVLGVVGVLLALDALGRLDWA